MDAVGAVESEGDASLAGASPLVSLGSGATLEVGVPFDGSDVGVLESTVAPAVVVGAAAVGAVALFAVVEAVAVGLTPAAVSVAMVLAPFVWSDGELAPHPQPTNPNQRKLEERKRMPRWVMIRMIHPWMHTYRVLIVLLVQVEALAVVLTLSARICVEHGFGLATTPHFPARRRPASSRVLTRGVFTWLMALGSVCGCSSEELLTLGRAPAEVATRDADAAPTEVATRDADAAPTGVATRDADAAPDAGDAGRGLQLPFVFDTPALVEELYSGMKDDNPTLTADMLEIYFSSKRGDENTDLWWAHRENIDQAFSEPVFLEELSTPEFDTSPAVEGDGLTFWFSSVREDGLGGLDIVRVTRASREAAWGEPTLVVELNSEQDDIPRPTGANGRIMPLGSRRGGGIYATYFATRPSVEEAFTDVVLVPDLAPPDAVAADAFLTADGLVILYSRSLPDQPADLYMAARPSLSEPFGEGVAIDTLNTEADERDPWLSPDGRTLYFASDRDGELAIYRAERR